MTQCDCTNPGEPRDVIDLYTPLYQACGGRLYRLHITEDARAVLMTDGVDVETRINSLERSLLSNTTTYFADNIAGREALTPLAAGDRCYVYDASADATVPYGAAMYMWMPSRKWIKLYNGDSPVDALNLIKYGAGLGAESNKLYVKVSEIIGQGLKDSGGKIAVDVSQLSGAGITVDSQGKIAVKVDSLPDSALAEIAARLVASGAGLKTVSGKLAVNAAELINSNGGLKVSSDKLSVDFSKIPAADVSSLTSSIVKPGSGLAAGSDGKISVDFSSMPAETLKAMVLPMIQTGGGLMVDSSGKIYFDAQSMDTSVFEALMKKLRLPLWLPANTDFYVDKSHANASDTLDEGRGLSWAKPFKSILAACDFVCENYNLSVYDVIIHVKNGDYSRDTALTCGGFSANTGKIYIRGAGRTNTILPKVDIIGGNWTIWDCTIKPTVGRANYNWGIRANNSVCGLLNVCLDMSEIPLLENCQLYSLYCDNNSLVTILSSTAEVENGLYLNNGSRELYYQILASNGSQFLFNADINLLSDIKYSWNNGSFVCASDATIKAAKSTAANPGRFPQINLNGHTVTGKRYKAYSGGKIIVNSSGAEYFPGTVDGTAEAQSYSWYY